MQDEVDKDVIPVISEVKDQPSIQQRVQVVQLWQQQDENAVNNFGLGVIILFKKSELFSSSINCIFLYGAPSAASHIYVCAVKMNKMNSLLSEQIQHPGKWHSLDIDIPYYTHRTALIINLSQHCFVIFMGKAVSLSSRF